MAKIFKSHGKLMITGEYFVLRGAKSLLLPTKFYQDMIVSKLDDDFGRQIRERALDSSSLGVAHQKKNIEQQTMNNKQQSTKD